MLNRPLKAGSQKNKERINKVAEITLYSPLCQQKVDAAKSTGAAMSAQLSIFSSVCNEDRTISIVSFDGREYSGIKLTGIRIINLLILRKVVFVFWKVNLESCCYVL
jgi:hypothetical protein